MTHRWAVWLLLLVLALHNLEEGLFFPRYVRRVLGRLPAGLRDWIGPVSLREMEFALMLATAIPLGFCLSRRAQWALVPAAVALHLPGALGVMLLGRALSGSG